MAGASTPDAADEQTIQVPKEVWDQVNQQIEDYRTLVGLYNQLLTCLIPILTASKVEPITTTGIRKPSGEEPLRTPRAGF